MSFASWHGILSTRYRTRAHAKQTLDEDDNLIGVVVSKLEPHRGGPLRGYIAMLAVKEEYRGKSIATKLARMTIDAMIEQDADEVSMCSCPLYGRAIDVI